jgi:hypothetical protein
MLSSKMNKQEARDIAAKNLEVYRNRPYTELTRMIKAEPITLQVRGASGVLYNLEIQAFLDDKANGNIRVKCAIDDGGWRSYFPMSDDFIKSPSEEIVGEQNESKS